MSDETSGKDAEPAEPDSLKEFGTSPDFFPAFAGACPRVYAGCADEEMNRESPSAESNGTTKLVPVPGIMGSAEIPLWKL